MINKLIPKNLLDLININGSISISKYIEFCLYNSKNGYYQKKQSIGYDFTTAPEISQIFGECISIFFLFLLENFKNKSTSNTFIELGPGNGTLAKDILRVLKLNKNIRNTETGRIGFVAPDGTLQIYPDNTTPDKIANCPNSAPIDISNADFEAFPSKINLSEQQPCKTVRLNRIHERLKEVEQRIKNIFRILKEEVDAEIKAKKERGEGEVTTPVDQQLVDRISELSEVNNALKLSNQDVQSLEGIETVADIMRIFSFYRIFMWFILVLIGLSIVYSIYRNGGKMSFLSAFFFGSLIATWVYFNLNMILRIPPLSWFFGPTFQF